MSHELRETPMDDVYAIRLAKTELRDAYNKGDANRVLAVFVDAYTHNTTRGTSGGAVQFGGGVDVRTPIKVLFPIGLRAEVRDLYTAKPITTSAPAEDFSTTLCCPAVSFCIFERPYCQTIARNCSHVL